ncbi:MAG: STAS domain-containing protein [Chloroflexota bacterium]|jgi:anti-anti-sigma factor
METNVIELKRLDLLEIEGRVDSNTASALHEVLNERIDQGTSNILVDLSNVSYMSSAGLRELVTALKRVRKNGGDLRLCAPSERVTDVIELAGLNSLFEIFDDRTMAVGSF